MLRRQAHRILHFATGEAVPIAQEGAELADERFDPVEALPRPLHDEFVPAGADAHAEEVLEQAQVVVVGAEQDLDALFWDRDGTRGRDSDTDDLLVGRPAGTAGPTLPPVSPAA